MPPRPLHSSYGLLLRVGHRDASVAHLDIDRIEPAMGNPTAGSAPGTINLRHLLRGRRNRRTYAEESLRHRGRNRRDGQIVVLLRVGTCLFRFPCLRGCLPAGPSSRRSVPHGGIALALADRIGSGPQRRRGRGAASQRAGRDPGDGRADRHLRHDGHRTLQDDFLGHHVDPVDRHAAVFDFSLHASHVVGHATHALYGNLAGYGDLRGNNIRHPAALVRVLRREGHPHLVAGPVQPAEEAGV